MIISQLASAIYNDVVSGLKGITGTPTISIEQIEDEIIEERLSIIKEWQLKNIFTRKDHLLSINCIELDCKSMAKCCKLDLGAKGLHFEIPPLVNDLKNDAIEYIGAIDRGEEYKFYTDISFKYHKYKRRKSHTPIVYIESAINENGMYDCWLFNNPFAKYISIIGVFKDPRLLLKYGCCNDNIHTELGAISSEIKKRLTEKKLRYYRQFLAPTTPNTQEAK